MIKYDVLHRLTGEVKFTADIDCDECASRSLKLSSANLNSANLNSANLNSANLRGADLRAFKHDVWAVCMYAINEVPALIDAIKGGRIDGSQYEGECCCLCGTLEKGLKANIDIRSATSPAEQWFSMIREGDKPEDNFASEMALRWVEEFYAMVNIKGGV